MKTRRDTIRLIMSASALPLIPASAAQAGTVAGFGGSTEITQILNNAQLLFAAGQQAVTAANTARNIVNQGLQIANQLNAYRNMIENTLSLPDQLWGQIKGEFSDLWDNITTVQGLSYRQADIDEHIRNRFFSFDEYVASDLNKAQYDERMRGLSQDIDDRVAQSYEINKLFVRSNERKAEFLELTLERMNSADGTNEILKEAGALAATTSQLMLQLSEQFADQGDVTKQYAEIERDRENAERAQQEEYLNSRPTIGRLQ